MKSEAERIIEWSPAWDKSDDDPKKNYGIHGMDLKFLLKGDKGVIQFVIYTNWQLPHVRKEWNEKVNAHLLQPIPADVGYHSPVPMYEGQEPIQEECEYLDGKTCYYDGSGLYAQKVFDIFVTDGEEAMWKTLEEEYRQRFEKGDESEQGRT